MPLQNSLITKNVKLKVDFVSDTSYNKFTDNHYNISAN